MKVLVTGAAGRVGANVVKRFAARGIDVRAMIMPGDSNASKLASMPGVEIAEADLRDQDAIDVACRGVTHVVHLAAQLVRGDTPVDRFYDVNALGTLRMLEGVVHAGLNVERFVLASTEGTYCPGAPPAVPLTEEVEQQPGEYYGTSKLLGEIIMRNHAAQYDIPYSIVRFPTVVSPEEADKIFRLNFWRGFVEWQKQGKNNHLWPLFHGQPDLSRILKDAVKDAPGEVAVGFVGPDDAPWTLSMLDVRDAAEGVYLALTEPGALGRALNIAAAQATPHHEGARIVSELYGVPSLMVRMPMNWRLEISADAARKAIGYQPRYDYRGMVESGRAESLSDLDAFVPAQSSSGIGSLP